MDWGFDLSEILDFSFIELVSWLDDGFIGVEDVEQKTVGI